MLGHHELYEFGHHPYIETVAQHTVPLLGGDALWEGWGGCRETAKDQNKTFFRYRNDQPQNVLGRCPKGLLCNVTFLLPGLTQAGGEAHEVGDLPRREVAEPQSAQPPQLLLILPCRQLLQAFEHRVHLGDERRGEVNPTRATRCSGHFQDCCCFHTIDQGSFCDFALKALETLEQKNSKGGRGSNCVCRM